MNSGKVPFLIHTSRSEARSALKNLTKCFEINEVFSHLGHMYKVPFTLY